MIDGFIQNGMLDPETKSHPCLHGMIKTLTRRSNDLTATQEKLLLDNFVNNFQEYRSKGMISEDFLVFQLILFLLEKESLGSTRSLKSTANIANLLITKLK